jgi:hypothetical protein
MFNKIFPGYQPCKLVKRRKNNVSRTISVLILRVLMYLGNQSVSDIDLPEFHVHDGALYNVAVKAVNHTVHTFIQKS